MYIFIELVNSDVELFKLTVMWNYSYIFYYILGQNLAATSCNQDAMECDPGQNSNLEVDKMEHLV